MIQSESGGPLAKPIPRGHLVSQLGVRLKAIEIR